MAPQIILLRHAEATHNVSNDFSHPDPSLTESGFEQAASLVQTFPNPSRIAVILTSPLRRTVQTTLAAFPHVLDKQYFAPGSGQGVENGAKLVLDPNLQERSDFPCDTGNESSLLKEWFPHLNFDELLPNDGWQLMRGPYAANDEAVGTRARAVRATLGELSTQLKESENTKTDIVAVTHGAFMKFLSEDPDIDLPKAGWRAYTAKEDLQGDFVLVNEQI